MPLSLSELKLSFEHEKERLLNDQEYLLRLVEDMVFHCEKLELSDGSDDSMMLADHKDNWNRINTRLKADSLPITPSLLSMMEEMIDIDLLSSKNLKRGQSWFIKKERAAGYDVSRNGQCFGVAHMSMQAFLADDQDTFNARLDTIHQTNLEDFEEDFHLLRMKQQTLEKLGDQEEAAALNQSIVDMSAFFNGLVLFQETHKYAHLFDSSFDVVHLQDTEKALELTTPVTLTNNPPTHINTHAGAYSKSDLILYIDSLKQHLGQHSFSLVLCSENHAINLNYNAEHKEWILIDPNRLPGETYTHTSLLADTLLRAYSINKKSTMKGIVLECDVWL